jgi:hypothetical protein
MLKIRLATLFTLLTMSSAVFAGGSNKGCKPDSVPGSYVRADPTTDVFFNGTNIAHTFIYQLNLHSDGTADQYWTGFPDYLMELGSASPWIGSWKCRDDGKLVVTLLHATYSQTPPSAACNTGPVCVPTADIALDPITAHVRSTYLFSVENNNNTLRRVQSRARYYSPTEDPTDPGAGSLRPLMPDQVVYKRFKASDADLLAP